VLRLMASVIHSLWEKGDRSPIILPSSIPIDDPRVQFELTRYLPDNWVPVIEKDVDGPNSLPLRFDGETPNLGKYSACRRVARTIYLGSARRTGRRNHPNNRQDGRRHTATRDTVGPDTFPRGRDAGLQTSRTGCRAHRGRGCCSPRWNCGSECESYPGD
jgi:hypothetical protein